MKMSQVEFSFVYYYSTECQELAIKEKIDERFIILQLGRRDFIPLNLGITIHAVL